MAGQAKPTVRSRQVSSELRRLRRARGLTTGDVGSALGVSQSKISRIENSQLGLHLEEVAAMLGLYHVSFTRREEILDMVRQAGKPGWVEVHGRGLSEQWKALIDFEKMATALWNYEPFVVPGLLQTPDYARAVIQMTDVRQRTDAEIETMVAARLDRQRILSRPLGADLQVLLYEPVLRMPVGGYAVLAAQLRHLAEVCRRSRVSVHVVPVAAGAHPGLESPFVIMEFESYSTLVYLENKVLSVFLEEEPHIDAYQLAWEAILASALSAQQSAEFIGRSNSQ
ncbi:DUF5753 domain-containing protein [Fodinicola feengrottensis]|uniref:DUF5753 domain-containing protein n=1 Tax=Fodinicola feengrottensis TaxID=435914 RepID=UPI0013D40F3D|nr:DUF5753 domain-containing protein [Fodinicola feengrottensis]